MGEATPPFALAGIDHVLLLVNGMAAARSFYCKVLGCTVEDQLPQFAMLQLRAGASLIDLVDVSSPQGSWALPQSADGRNLDHLCLALHAYDEAALRAHLALHGIPIVEEGRHGGARGDSLSLYVKDPAGNTIELKGPP
ncbi:MAG TPA: VOC family protein [Steroidobacteraceae bacterium]|jgi:glyoxylase I family protein